jgi:hypothetical protein
MILTVVDTSGIQNYIFGSNRLKDNIGGSQLVWEATGVWARECCKLAGGEKHYSGGGNFMANFPEESQARQFERMLTRYVLCHAPGLKVVVAHHECEQIDAEAIQQAFQNLRQEKACRGLSLPLGTLPITQPCGITGLPAITTDAKENNSPISLSIQKQRGAATRGNDRLGDELTSEKGYRYPYDFDELGRDKHDQSYIAVVHADGNGLGRRLIEIARREGSNGVKAFSEAVNTASVAALKKTLTSLEAIITGYDLMHGRIHISLKSDKSDPDALYLPFRPIVYGGDDVTFVCDGHLGIALATCYLEAFEKETSKPEIAAAIGGCGATACAGIAIVKTHYPFSRAYQLAEDLCKSAKAKAATLVKADAVSQNSLKPEGYSCLDWYFALSGVTESLEKMREKEYCVSAGNLSVRPVILHQETESDISWKYIEEQIGVLQRGLSQSKIKMLREVVRDGEGAVKKMQQFFLKDIANRDITSTDKKTIEINKKTIERYLTNAWVDHSCTIFDAIELADIHFPVSLATGDASDAAVEGSN